MLFLENNRCGAMLNGKEVVGKKVLILGEVGSGKTKLAAKIIQELTRIINPEKITVIDLAPERTGDVGGKLTDYTKLACGIKYFSPLKIYTPRLTGKSPDEVLHYAEMNKKAIEPLLDKYTKNPTEALIINDVTLYFHLGELEKILECIRLAKTFLATAYCGERLSMDFGTGISKREKQLTERLSAFMDIAIKID